MAKSPNFNTRAKITCPVFGAPKVFSEVVLPTHEDMFRHYLWVQHSLETERNGQYASVAEVSEVVASKLKELWEKASIPTVGHNRILQKIRAYNDKYRKLLKPYQKRKDAKGFKAHLQTFKDDAKQLFDLAACKCDFSACTCEKSRRVPLNEHTFLTDQRTVRRMVISSTDVSATKRLRNKAARKENEAASLASSVTKQGLARTSFSNELSSDSPNTADEENDSVSDDDDIFQDPVPSTSKEGSSQMRLSLPTVAITSDRFGVSDRAAAAIASSVLEDVGFITAEDSCKVIDKSKLRRERQKKRIQLQSHTVVELQGIYFDGRKDKTLIQENEGTKLYRRTITEEHVSIVQQPESEYLVHVTPMFGSAVSIKTSIVALLKQNNINTQKLTAVGCDGTNVNTGRKGGVVRLLEEEMGRPMHWFACQLHANELPFRHLLEHLDGDTKGPLTYSGLIGKGLENCENLPIQQFNKIECELPAITLSRGNLSTDQKYLLEMCQAISTGVCSADLAKRDPGRLSHSRWLTTANRVLRLYCGTKTPTANLIILTEYVLKVYARVWFRIKMKPSCKYVGIHVWETVYFSRYLDEELKKIIDPVIQRNAYFAHPENLLLCMITDERIHIRQLGLRRIMKARKTKITESVIRRFEIPPLNFHATDYIDLIQWQEIRITEPPLLTHVPNDDLQSFIRGELSPGMEFPRFPCHTQSVERCVKMVTDAAASVCGEKNRDGYIRAKLQSRAIMPEFEKKVRLSTTIITPYINCSK